MDFHQQRPAARVRPQRNSTFAMIVGFLPVIVFALLANVSQDLALWAAFAGAFTVAMRDFAREQLLRILDVGSTLLFGLLALYTGFIKPDLSIEMTRLIVDTGFFALALVSILLRNPLTLQYAREHAPRELWTTKRFMLTNYGLTAFWMLAFGLMAATDAFADVHKTLPRSLDAAAGLVVLLVAVGVTARYPAHLRARTARARLCAGRTGALGSMPTGRDMR
ncbi:MAG TPA: hypothetical protein VHX61_11260 [Rhizomicrobium sp.]|jgi:hypothetical protein|nr:hypothetical protein [Rhizomicrobium sp.]